MSIYTVQMRLNRVHMSTLYGVAMPFFAQQIHTLCPHCMTINIELDIIHSLFDY